MITSISTVVAYSEGLPTGILGLADQSPALLLHPFDEQLVEGITPSKPLSLRIITDRYAQGVHET
jgi:hypothetical protein